MTTSNVLSLPFRKSTHISLSSAIQQYISKKYDQHPEMFRHDLDVIDALRRDAVNVREPHLSGIKRLQTYAGQLVWMSGKFPIDIGADFTWYPALGYHTDRPLVENNLKYELLNVLYNLAALYSQLAVGKNRNNPEELKAAANQFSQAAGVLEHMRKEVLPELRMASPPDDMDEATLESLTQLMLAQSQECFWQKAVMDRYKDISIAKLSARVSDLYNMAGEAAVRSEAISSAWIHHMSAKHHHFAAAAQYRAACDCLEKRKYGEEVARLMDAVICVNEGLKECKGNYLGKAVVEDLHGLKTRVEEDLKRAEKDNDVIYLNPVPAKSDLKILERANMAVARVPPEVKNPFDFLGDHGEFGPGLFTKLVPYSVTVAISIYEERRDRLVNSSIISELESLTVKLHEILSGLNLPGSLQALEKPLGLPGTVVQRADEIRQADGLGRLQSGFADVNKLRTKDHAVFEEAKSLLAAEEEEDMRLRRKYGTQQWARPESREDPSTNGGARLWSTAAEIEDYFASSTSSDAVVREKYDSIKDTLALLAGPDRGLLDYIPNSRRAEIPESVKPALGRLRSAFNEAQRLESRRRKHVESLRARARADDVRADILAETARLERTFPLTAISPAHFEDFFARRLDTLYEKDQEEATSREAAAQDKVVADVQRASRDFEAQKRAAVGTDRGAREREAALQRLDNAYFRYKEIVSNLEVGRKFYNDLSHIVGQFREQARAWVTERRKDARSLEDEISMPPLAHLSINNHPQSPSAQPQSQLAAKAPSYYPASPPPEPRIQNWVGDAPPQQPRPMPAPVANVQGIWTPEMAIKFAPGAVGGQAGGGAGQQGETAPASGTWEPENGIRFG